ncbi:MAG: HAD-IIIA family hydrolase [Sideroxydans sp.]
MATRKVINGNEIELIAFDFDGTLIDSTTAIVESIQSAAADIGVPVPSDERASHIIGLGLFEALRRAVPDLPHERYQELTDRYRHHYFARDSQLRLFVGVEAMLDELAGAGYLLTVATGKSRAGLDRALAATGLGRRFLSSRCADECHSKPHPQMLQELMDEFGISPEATLVIGDTTHDLQMAKNAGAHAVAVTYGAHPRDSLEAEHPAFCANNVEELMNWFNYGSDKTL